MGKASSSKKVARAARAGQSSGPTERRQLGFPLAMALVVILGIGLVAWARENRDPEELPRLSDHWHIAYAVYDCTTDSILDPFTSEIDPAGIHSHSDGLIHVHPFGSNAAGANATLEVFLDAMLVNLDDDQQLVLEDGTAISAEGAGCNGEAAVWQIARWASAADTAAAPEIITQNLSDVRFLADGEALTIALAPLGADIPPPPSAVSIDDASDNQVSEGPVTELGESDTPGTGE